jgi:hypothetical protein
MEADNEVIRNTFEKEAWYYTNIYIVLQKNCIVNNKRIEDEWIVEVENKLVKRRYKMRDKYKMAVNYKKKELKLLKW